MKNYLLPGRFRSYDLLKLCSFFSKEYGTCLLYSGGQFNTCNKSYLFLFPFESFSLTHSKFKNKFNNFNNVISVEDVWEKLDEKITDHFWSGFLSYEMGAFSDKSLITSITEPDIPLAYFQRCLVVLELSHQSSQITLHLEDFNKSENSKHVSYAKKLINLADFLNEIPEIKKNKVSSSQLISKESKSSYINKINNLHELILSGDVYQLNLSHEIILNSSSSYFDIFYNLIINNPTPFSAYFYLNDNVIVSNSPERLVKKENSFLEARPIKGTVKRGESKEQEKINILKLISSEKEKAELVMITDLLRNDLSKVSAVGSIKTKLYQLEKYENIIHMLSIVSSIADSNFSSVDILREIFPGGSITGCPKLKAKELIHSFEKRARNIYTGSVGYFKGKDSFDFNICIRTMLFKANLASIQLGGAIVFDSDPDLEFLETLIKGKSLFNAINYTDHYEHCIL